MTRGGSWAVSPFPWFGGKQRLARRLADLLPPHLVYVEPFGGAAAVLLTKPPARLEVYNDADEGLVTFFRVLRDEPAELERRLRLTPFSRVEFEDCRDTWRDVADDVERARRWYVRVEQAFAGTPTTRGWGGERRGRRHQSRAETSISRLDRIASIARRLRSVQIECLDWRDCLERYDGPDAVFYLDPPYVPGTRWSGGKGYEAELTTDDHVELVARVVELEASVLLSGYHSPLYAPLEKAGFERREFEATASSASVGGAAARRTEILWRRSTARDLFSALNAGD